MNPQDAKQVKDVLDQVCKDLGVPIQHPVRRLLKKIGDEFIKEAQENTIDNYNRAMKGIK